MRPEVHWPSPRYRARCRIKSSAPIQPMEKQLSLPSEQNRTEENTECCMCLQCRTEQSLQACTRWNLVAPLCGPKMPSGHFHGVQSLGLHRSVNAVRTLSCGTGRQTASFCEFKHLRVRCTDRFSCLKEVLNLGQVRIRVAVVHNLRCVLMKHHWYSAQRQQAVRNASTHCRTTCFADSVNDELATDRQTQTPCACGVH
jgi:hypothetical protein